jgi:hypothetical protein
MELGVRFEPEVMSLGRALRSFAFDEERIRVSPISAELSDILLGHDTLPERLNRFRALRGFQTVVFHELNHYIMFRSVLPAWSDRPRRDEVKSYFTLIESLVILRDSSLASELGPLSSTLRRAGVLYRDERHASPCQGEPTYEEFREKVISGFRVLGGANIRSAIGTSSDFVRTTHRAWLRGYFKAHGARLKLKPARHGLPCVKVRLPRLATGEISHGEMKKLHAWYLEMFHQARESANGTIKGRRTGPPNKGSRLKK